MFKDYKKVGFDIEVKDNLYNIINYTFTAVNVIVSLATISIVILGILFYQDYNTFSSRKLVLNDAFKVAGLSELSNVVVNDITINGHVFGGNYSVNQTGQSIVINGLTTTTITTNNITMTNNNVMTFMAPGVGGSGNVYIKSSYKTLYIFSLNPPQLGGGETNAGLVFSPFSTIGESGRRLYYIMTQFLGALGAGNRVDFIWGIGADFTGNVQAATFNGVSDPKIKQNIVQTNETETLRKFMNIGVVDYTYNASYAIKFNKPLDTKVTGILSTNIRDNVDASLTNEGPLDLSLDGNTPNIINATYVDKLGLLPLNIKAGQVAIRRSDKLKAAILAITAKINDNTLTILINTLFENY